MRDRAEPWESENYSIISHFQSQHTFYADGIFHGTPALKLPKLVQGVIDCLHWSSFRTLGTVYRSRQTLLTLMLWLNAIMAKTAYWSGKIYASGMKEYCLQAATGKSSKGPWLSQWFWTSTGMQCEIIRGTLTCSSELCTLYICNPSYSPSLILGKSADSWVTSEKSREVMAAANRL